MSDCNRSGDAFGTSSFCNFNLAIYRYRKLIGKKTGPEHHAKKAMFVQKISQAKRKKFGTGNDLFIKLSWTSNLPASSAYYIAMQNPQIFPPGAWTNLYKNFEHHHLHLNMFLCHPCGGNIPICKDMCLCVCACACAVCVCICKYIKRCIIYGDITKPLLQNRYKTRRQTLVLCAH